MVHWSWSAKCLIVRVRSSFQKEETQAEEFKIILERLLMIYDVGVEYDHLPSESLSFCIKKFIFSWSKLSLLYVRPPLLKPLEHRNFRCPSTTEERREHTTENDFHYVMAATDIYKLLADGSLSDYTSSAVNACIR